MKRPYSSQVNLMSINFIKQLFPFKWLMPAGHSAPARKRIKAMSTEL